MPLPVAADAPKVERGRRCSRRSRRRGPRSRRRCGSRSAPTRWRLPRWRIATLLDLPPTADARRSRSAARARTPTSRGSQSTVDRPPRDADFAVDLERASASSRPGRASALDVPRAREAILAAAISPGARARRSSPSRTTEPQLHDRRGARRWASPALVGSYTTIYGGDPNRIHNVQLVAHLIDRHADRARRDVLVQRHDRRAHGGEGLPRGAGDHQRRAPDGARRRRLPGLDDRLQRRLRGGPQDHGAHEPRALHQPLPARPRRDGQLSRTSTSSSSTTRGHWLLAAHVRRRVVADRRASTARRSTGASRARPRRSSSPAPPPVEQTPDPTLPEGETVIEERGRAAAVDAVDAQGLHASGKLLYDDTWYSSYRAEPRVVRVGTKAPPPPTKPPPTDDHDGATTGTTTTATTTTGADDYSASALAIASASQAGHARRPERRRVDAGVRRPAVGDERSVRRRSSAYSKRKRAPRTLAAARVDLEPVVEARRREVAHVRLDRQRLDALLAQARVAAREAVEVVDAGDLEPDEVARVVRDRPARRSRRSGRGPRSRSGSRPRQRTLRLRRGRAGAPPRLRRDDGRHRVCRLAFLGGGLRSSTASSCRASGSCSGSAR